MAQRKSKKKRVPIPKRLEREVLFRNQSVCCICGKRGVQIHHIDGNPANNSISNLCVLCIEHHAEASSKSTMTKALDAALLRRYKAEWEGSLAQKRKVAAARQPRTDMEKAFVRFEIKKTLYALPEKDKTGIIDAFDYLRRWEMIEGDIRYLLDILSLMQWFLSAAQTKVIIDRFHEFFWQYADPNEVPMSKTNERVLVYAAEILGDFGETAAIVGHSISVLQSILHELYILFQIGRIYRRKAIGERAIKAIRGIEKDWNENLRQEQAKKRPKKRTFQAVTIMDRMVKQMESDWKESNQFRKKYEGYIEF